MKKLAIIFAMFAVTAALIGAGDVDAPATVAQTSFLNQTSDVALTTVYTTAATGTYRITEYGTSSISISQSVPMTFGWTDDVGAQSTDTGRGAAPTPIPALSGGAYNTNTFVVHAVSGTAITFKTTCGCALGAGSFFDVFVSVEKL